MVFNSLNEYKIYNNTNYEIKDEIKSMKKILKHALKSEKIKNASFNVILIDDKEITKINKMYRKKNKPTDVISFALEDNKESISAYNKRILGDIYISVETAKKQAKEYNHSLKRELCFLSVHGLLHLLGYDHIEEKDEKIMFKKQELILDGQRLWNVKKSQKKFQKIYKIIRICKRRSKIRILSWTKHNSNANTRNSSNHSRTNL